MPLNFYFDKVKPGPNGEEVWLTPDKERRHPIAEAIIMQSMNLGYNKITEENYLEVGRRLMISQIINGPLIGFGDGEKAYITTEDVKLYIGFQCNASATTPRQFDANVIRVLGLEMLDRQTLQKTTAYETVAKRYKEPQA